jgi:hypothetical protein
MSVTEIQLFQILKAKLGEKEAEELVSYVKAEVQSEFDNRKEFLATKEDLANVRADLMKSIYIVGMIQYLAIVGSLLVIINFMIK